MILQQRKTALQTIDSQHSVIIPIITLIENEKNLNVYSEIFTDSISNLTNYFIQYFQAEETLLKQAGYFLLPQMIEEHDTFSEKLIDICFKAMSYDEVAPLDLLELVKKLKEDHIPNSDAKALGYIRIIKKIEQLNLTLENNEKIIFKLIDEEFKYTDQVFKEKVIENLNLRNEHSLMYE